MLLFFFYWGTVFEWRTYSFASSQNFFHHCLIFQTQINIWAKFDGNLFTSFYSKSNNTKQTHKQVIKSKWKIFHYKNVVKTVHKNHMKEPMLEKAQRMSSFQPASQPGRTEACSTGLRLREWPHQRAHEAHGKKKVQVNYWDVLSRQAEEGGGSLCWKAAVTGISNNMFCKGMTFSILKVNFSVTSSCFLAITEHHISGAEGQTVTMCQILTWWH